MNMTINISLPQEMYKDVQKTLKRLRYTSISEFIRDSLREKLYPELTENGFTPEFEEGILKSAKEPIDERRIWRNSKDIEKYFNKLKKQISSNTHNNKDRKI